MKNAKESRFLLLVEENEDRIRRICRYYNINRSDQEDMYQEILINVWKNLDRFRGDAKLSTWVYRVAINTALNVTSKTFKRNKVFLPHDPELLQPVFDEVSLEEKIKTEEMLNRLQEEMNLLSIIDKALLSLFLEQIPMKEIAEIIGITEPNVRVKLHRIKTNLKIILKPESHETI